MLKAFKLRLYPNQVQREQIDININHCRFLWNLMLDMQNTRYETNQNAKFVTGYDMNLLLPTLKREYKWLKEADSTALQESNAQLDTAFHRFFKKIGGYPRFKSWKFSRKSYTTKMGMSLINKTHLSLAKLGPVSFKAKALPIGKINRVTVSISATGKYHALVLVDTTIKPFDKTGQKVGIDFGLTDLAIQSDGIKLNNVRFDKKLSKQKHYWEKRLARRRLRALSIIHEQKKQGRELQLSDFSNYARAKYQVSKINEKISNQRADYLQKYTTNLVKKYDVIAIEDLKTSNMLKNHKLARAIANASWRKMRELITYKANWYGKQVLVVNPRYTTQVDNETGEIKKHPLSTRFYTNNLGHLIDRDVNASKNILEWALNPKTRITKA